MSSTLPHAEPSSDFNIVEKLLRDQQSLTAVERFSSKHEAGELGNEPAQARYYRDLLPASPPSPDQQFAFEVDLDKCSGCKACVVACHTLNGLEEEESWRKVGVITIGAPSSSTSSGESPQTFQAASETTGGHGLETTGGVLTLPTVKHVTTACHHCEDPGCLNGCPVKAYEKDPVTGVVRHLDDQCIGCKYCTMMCPYEVPRYSDRLGIVRKCDMCHQRLSAGEAPACVQACPNEAIAITTVARQRDVDQHERLASGAPLSSITKPTTRYLSSHGEMTARATPQDEGIDQVAESHWPLAVMLIATQASVGLVACERILALIWWATGQNPSIDLTRWATLTALVIGGVGLNIAPLHLGQPLRAWRVFLGLRTSWLSREAVILGQYMGVLSLAVALLWAPVFANRLPETLSGWIPDLVFTNSDASLPSSSYDTTYRIVTKGLLGFSIPIGIMGLFSSSMIYVATRRLLWQGHRTHARFLGSAIILGGLVLANLTAFLGYGASMVSVGLFVLGVAGAKFLWERRILLDPSVSPPQNAGPLDHYDRRSRKLVQQQLAPLSRLRMWSGLMGLAVTSLAIFVAVFSPNIAGLLLVLAVIAMHAGELAERLLYFSSVVYDRMPGTL